MENMYGIGVTNRYAVFLNEELDPYETLKKTEQEKELKKKTKTAEKENKGKLEAPAKGKAPAAVKKVPKEAPGKVQENKRDGGSSGGENKPNHQRQTSESGKTERPFNKFNNENREERNNRRNREDRPFNGSFENNRDREDRPRKDMGDFESRRGRPASNKAVGRGGPRRQFDGRGKREFDRQSGSDKTHGYRGVKPIDKRDGGGAHNWGSHKDVIDEADQTKSSDDQNWGDDKGDVTTPEANKSGEGKTEIETAPVEEEPKELTLDEWKAQRAVRQKPQYNLRKAGEGEDPSQWKKMYELNKKKDGEEEQESEEEEYDTSEYPQRVGRQKHVLGIDFHFNDPRRGNAGRGRGARAGRGARNNRESRGGGGATGESKPGSNRFRGEEQREERSETQRNAPKVDDERDFPSLG